MKKNLRVYLFEEPDLDFGSGGGDLDFGSDGGDLDFSSGDDSKITERKPDKPKGPSAAQLLQTKLKELDASAPQTGKMDQATINLVMKLLNPKVEEVKQEEPTTPVQQNPGEPPKF